MFTKALKSELYRIRCLKSTFILPLVLVGLIFLTNFMYTRIDFEGLLGMSKEDVQSVQEQGTSAEGYMDSFRAGFEAGLQTASDIEEEQEPVKILGEGPLYHEDVATVFSLDVGSLYGPLLLAIFVGIFIGDVYSTGHDKNLIIFGGKRGLLFAARTILISLYALALHIVMWITAIVSTALMGESTVLGIDKSFVIFFVVTWLLTVAFGGLVSAMTNVTRSKAAGITLGIILSLGALSTIMSIASLVIQKKMGLEPTFNLGNYTVTQNIASMTLYSDGHFVLRALICAVIYFSVSYLISVLFIKKRDIG